MINRVAEEAQNGSHAAAAIEAAACEMASTVEKKAQESLERVQKFVAANPAVSLAVAVSMGVCLGWLLKRR